MKKKLITSTELRTQLAQKRLDVVPAGWMRADQWADEWGMSLPRTNELLLQGLREGLLEMETFRILTGSIPRKVRHYRERAPT